MPSTKRNLPMPKSRAALSECAAKMGLVVAIASIECADYESRRHQRHPSLAGIEARGRGTYLQTKENDDYAGKAATAIYLMAFRYRRGGRKLAAFRACFGGQARQVITTGVTPRADNFWPIRSISNPWDDCVKSSPQKAKDHDRPSDAGHQSQKFWEIAFYSDKDRCSYVG